VVNKSISLLDHRIRTVGISILGGNSGVEGKYELGIDSIKVVREVSDLGKEIYSQS